MPREQDNTNHPTCGAPWTDRRNLGRACVAVCDLAPGHRGDHSGDQTVPSEQMTWCGWRTLRPGRRSWQNHRDMRRDPEWLRDTRFSRRKRMRDEMRS